MSKVQEALQRLRDNHNAESAKRSEAGQDVSRIDLSKPNAPASPIIPGDESVRSRADLEEMRKQRSIEFEGGLGGKHSIAITEKTLSDAGLHLDVDDKELVAQQFRRIKRPILKHSFGVGAHEANANVIMVASALPGAGKTFCSFNLAESIARERDVGAVLVDADVLKPRMSRSLGLDDRPGLIDYLLDESINLSDILISSDYYDIAIVPAGRQHPESTELLASKRMCDFVQLLSRQFSERVVIFDTPPLLITNEAHVLAEHMGQIVLVIEAGESNQDSVVHALQSLNRNKPINAILNKARVGLATSNYGGEYTYQSYSDHERKTE